MSEILVNTIKKADGTGSLTVPAETGTVVLKDGSNDVTLNDITAGGIYLGGTGSANKLADYEEGTWTPTANVISFQTISATYTKIGNICIAHWYVNFPSTSDTNVARVKGLPFTVVNSDSQYGGGHIGLNNSGYTIIPFANRNSTEVLLRNENNSDYVNSNFSGRVLTGTVIYRVA